MCDVATEFIGGITANASFMHANLFELRAEIKIVNESLVRVMIAASVALSGVQPATCELKRNKVQQLVV
jgi:hypothetical protein